MHQLCKLGIAVPQRTDGNTGCKVEVLAVLNVPEPRTLALDKHGRRAAVRGDHVRLVLTDERGAGRALGRVSVW